MKRAMDLKRSQLGCGGMIRGRSGAIIRVKVPNPMFSEAIFILRDDIFAKGELSREEILRQAREAAGDYTAAVKEPQPAWHIAFFAALAGIVPGFILGFLY